MNPDIHERKHEDRIETVLAALGHAEPAPGMQQRICAALLHQTASPSRWTWSAVPQLAGLAVAVTAGVLLLLHAVSHHSGAPERTPTSTNRSVNADMNASVQPRQRQQPGRPTATPVHPVTAAWDSAPRTLKPALQDRPSTHESSPSAGPAIAEQGFPAPPLPLTEQERLLVRLVHRNDPVELALLTPAAREADRQRDREQVRDFFKAPPMLAANFTLEPYPTPGGTQ